MRDTAFTIVRSAYASREAIVKEEVLKKGGVRVEYSSRHACVLGNGIDDLPPYLVEELSNIGNSASELDVVQFAFLEAGEGHVPGVGGSHLRDSRKHLKELPLVNPLAHMFEPHGGPSSVYGRGDGKGSVTHNFPNRSPNFF